MQLHGDIRVQCGRAKSFPPQGVPLFIQDEGSSRKKKDKKQKAHKKKKKKKKTHSQYLNHAKERSEGPIRLTDKTYLLYRGYKSWVQLKACY